jgi:uncharacterized membrane protein
MSRLQKYFLFITLIIVGCSFIFSLVQAQTTSSSSLSEITLPMPVPGSESYFRAKVVTILEEKKQNLGGEDQSHQKLSLQILSGPDRGKRIEIDYGGSSAIQGLSRLNIGDVVVVAKSLNISLGKEVYDITDYYRGNSLIIVVLIFFVLAVVFGRKRGIMAIVGMLFSALVLFYFITPRILHGGNPLTASIIGGVLIIVFSLYLSHGFNKRTSIALVCSLLTLGFTIAFDVAFVSLTKLSGAGSEEAFYLQVDTGSIDLRGLLLGGIIIGVLGVLDDVTTAQVASIEEVAKANPRLTFKQLYTSGLSVGREHIASLVNTLVLAYVGAAFPLILLYSLNKNLPLWMLLNSNFIAEELVRTAVGSIALVLAVPITTVIASYLYRGLGGTHITDSSIPSVSREDRVRRLWGNNDTPHSHHH